MQQKSLTPFLIATALLLCACVKETAPRAPEEVTTETETHSECCRGDYIRIESSRRKMSVFLKDKEVRSFDHIAFGSAGPGIKRRKGDDITPLGTFRIASVVASEKYRFFIQLDYPSLEYAERGLKSGLIGSSTFEEIRNALEHGKTPPQDTVLGGHIGIHGLGQGNPEIHKIADWTRGCIAVDNQQIEELVSVVRPGMLVEIRP